jgi:hypothetical protein
MKEEEESLYFFDNFTLQIINHFDIILSSKEKVLLSSKFFYYFNSLQHPKKTILNGSRQQDREFLWYNCPLEKMILRKVMGHLLSLTTINL